MPNACAFGFWRHGVSVSEAARVAAGAERSMRYAHSPPCSSPT